MTKLIIVSRDHAATLARIKQYFPRAQRLRPDPAADFTYPSFTKDKARLIVVNLVHGNLEAQFSAPLTP